MVWVKLQRSRRRRCPKCCRVTRQLGQHFGTYGRRKCLECGSAFQLVVLRPRLICRLIKAGR